MILPDSMDYLMRPVLAGLCSYVEMADGTLALEDIALMNDALEARDENSRRYEEARKRAS